jgi:hypothetical protein
VIARVLVAAVVVLMSGAPAEARPRPVNEGGDYSHCATYEEAGLVNLGMPENRVHRILDTRGRPAGRREAAASFGAIGEAVPHHATVRSYRSCAQPTNPDFGGDPLLIAFSDRSAKHRVIAVYDPG